MIQQIFDVWVRIFYVWVHQVFYVWIPRFYVWKNANIPENISNPPRSPNSVYSRMTIRFRAKGTIHRLKQLVVVFCTPRHLSAFDAHHNLIVPILEPGTFLSTTEP